MERMLKVTLVASAISGSYRLGMGLRQQACVVAVKGQLRNRSRLWPRAEKACDGLMV
jgi:hypothetical protein